MASKLGFSGNDSDELREACGVFGCIASGSWPTELDVAQIVYLGLTGLQHRGQESCGITTSLGDKNKVQTHKKDGLIGNAFKQEDIDRLRGNLGIGHTRYSTTGGTNAHNTQPFVVHTKHGVLSLAHNGELVNASKLRQEILEQGIGLSTESDSELMVQILCMPPDNEKDTPDWPARIKHLMEKTKASYSLLIMCGDKIYAVRDPYGNRPLCLGKVVALEKFVTEMLHVDIPQENINGNVPDNGAGLLGYVVSSESCAFSSFGGKLVREVKPGEIVEISKHGFKSISIKPSKAPAFCIFEYVYFARPDSMIEGQMIYTARKECGAQLAIQAPVEADVVGSVPESSTPAALGFSEQSGIPYAEVLCKSRYIGRTFIQPTKALREVAVRKKFGPLPDNVKGKRVILIDDSIVRGTTIKVIISLLRNAGATEVHLRIASPPVRNPCFMGINIPTKEELIANTLNEEQLAKKIGADTLVHLTVENLVAAVKKNAYQNSKNSLQNGENTHQNGTTRHCTGCLTGKYPDGLEW